MKPGVRLYYSLCIAAILALGLLSRCRPSIPLFIGDIVWAALVYFLFRFVCLRARVSRVFTYGLLFSYTIEFSQLYQAPWINELRKSMFGRLVLGSSFVWTDLLCYLAGLLLAAGLDSQNRKKWVR